MIAKILETFEMNLPDPDPNDPWFLDWVLRSPTQAGTHLVAGWHALLDVQDSVGGHIETATEYFGGIGAQALMAEEIFDLTDHVVGDFSAAAAAHMTRALPDIWVRQADAYDPANTQPADLALLDFGDLTAWKALRPDPRSELLDRVFMLEPKSVVLTDIASRYLHLHRERYESLLGQGTCDSYRSYLEAFAAKIEDRWGYQLLSGYQHAWSTVMAFVPSDLDRPVGEIKAVPHEPLGLELLP